MSEAKDYYPTPKDGWVCFHCGERFTTPGSAQDHFGARPEDMAACRIKVGEERGLVMALRQAQDQIRCLQAYIDGIHRGMLERDLTFIKERMSARDPLDLFADEERFRLGLRAQERFPWKGEGKG